MKTFTEILKQHACECIQLSENNSASVIHIWYQKFSRSVMIEHGRYDFFQCDWEVFSSGMYPSLEGVLAIKEFEKMRCNKFYYMLGDKKSQIFSCQNSNRQLPRLGFVRSDLTFCDSEIKWTMCYTLENNLGPYFAYAG